MTKEICIIQKTERKQGEIISFSIDNHTEPGLWTGEIVGVANTGYPVIGIGYIVKVTSGQVPNSVYQFDTIVVFDNWIDDKV